MKKRTEKRCSKCKKIKPISEFRPDKRTSSGFGYWCRDCRRNGSRRYRKNHPYRRWAAATIGDHRRRGCQLNFTIPELEAIAKKATRFSLLGYQCPPIPNPLPSLSEISYVIKSYAENTILDYVGWVLLTISKKLCLSIWTGDDFMKLKLPIIALILMVPKFSFTLKLSAEMDIPSF